MGFEDREYYRSEAAGGFFAAAGWAVKWLVAINVAVFLLQILTVGQNRIQFSSWIAFEPSRVLSGEIWRVVTHGFGFGGHPLVFLFDTYFLWIFGKSVEELYGSRELIFFYLLSTVASALACLAAAVATGVSIPVLGSAVPVMAVTVLYAWHFPRTQVLFFFLIPVEIWLLVTGYVLLNLFQAAAIGFQGGPFIAGLTAVGFALLYAKAGWRLESIIPAGRPTLRLPRKKPKLRVFEPEPREDLDKKVDDILAKIHAQGESSLTDRERKTLQEASKRYKKT